MARNRGKHKQPKLDPRISDALRDHAILTRWYEKPGGRYYLSQFSQYDGLLASTFEMMKLNAENQFPDYILHMLRSAETFALTHEMHSLVHSLALGSAEDTIPESMCLHELPAMEGFVRLPEPILLRDISKVDYPMRAFAWYVDPTRVYEWSDTLKRKMPVVSIALFSENWKDDPYLVEHGKPPPGPALSLLHFAPFNLDDLRSAWHLSDYERADPRVHNEDQAEYQMPARYMVLFWLVANQKLASHRRYEARQLGGITAMRAREAKIVPRVRVITLRRERVQTDPDPEGGGREFSHRWAVRAHWRHQPCGPGRQDRKWVLVTAHIRGPDDKPLILKERAFDLRR